MMAVSMVTDYSGSAGGLCGLSYDMFCVDFFFGAPDFAASLPQIIHKIAGLYDIVLTV
jgi:hypothetical protein